MMKTITQGEEDEPDFSVMNMKQDESIVVQADGSVLLPAQKGGAVANFFRRKRTTKVELFGGDNRVPFVALYQVNTVMLLLAG